MIALIAYGVNAFFMFLLLRRGPAAMTTAAHLYQTPAAHTADDPSGGRSGRDGGGRDGHSGEDAGWGGGGRGSGGEGGGGGGPFSMWDGVGELGNTKSFNRNDPGAAPPRPPQPNPFKI